MAGLLVVACNASHEDLDAGAAGLDGAGECAAGATRCDGRCVDTTSDEAACGGCATACGDGYRCVDSVCACLEREVCDGACADLETSSAHCGACGNA
ncbi:MAG TPA: hypothetical protein DEF51_05415, partial [Myxococcales bacterium]|nr:hypothetical protein [Myxococcales bacterium]